MTKLYVLHHIRADDEFGDDAKLIGVYESPEAVDGAIERLRDKPGFRDHPVGFHADAYGLNEDNWTEGFGFD